MMTEVIQLTRGERGGLTRTVSDSTADDRPNNQQHERAQPCTMPEIPIFYTGRRYRNRAEAKWAAFFDALGWRHEYEPLDLEDWSPTFLIHPIYGVRLFVAVEPIVDWQNPISVGQRLHNARAPLGNTLLVGLCPEMVTVGNRRAFRIGWSPCEDDAWDACYLTQHPPTLGSPAVIDAVTRFGGDDWLGSLAYGGGFAFSGLDLMPDFFRDLWAQACNSVQQLGREP